MSVEKNVAVSLDDLPMDVFELPDHGLTAESLTAGHGMTETSASACSTCLCDYTTCTTCTSC